MRKLSKSACEKWMSCPASFDYYYNQQIRPIKTGSALMFGSGMDSALNELLLPSGIAPMDAYRATVDQYELGKVLYSAKDFDFDLLTDERKAALLPKLNANGYPGDNIDELFTALRSKVEYGETLSENQERVLCLIYRDVFEAKAELMVEAYRTHVLPNISEVYNVQKRAGPGVLDATVEWIGRGKIIIDNKTSSRRYSDSSVETSVQFAMYSAEEKINDCAYVVLLKDINKNKQKACSICGHVGKGSHKTCDAPINASLALKTDREAGKRCGGEWKISIAPECEIQVVHGTITPEAQAVAAELQEQVQRAVDAKIFPCNVAQCHSQFGKACDYRNLKWKNDMTGLEVKPRGNKK